MNILFTVLVVKALALTPGASQPTPPPNQSNTTPSLPLNQGNSQSTSQPPPLAPTNTIPLFPVYQRAPQPPNRSLPPPAPPCQEFVAMEPGPHGPLPHEFHTMDRLSLCVLNYFFACGLSHTSTWSQRPSLSTSVHVQCFLNQTAFSLFLLANALFPRTRPALAFVLDRLSFLLIVISAYLASMPMFPPYLAIIMFLLVAIFYIFVRFRG